MGIEEIDDFSVIFRFSEIEVFKDFCFTIFLEVVRCFIYCRKFADNFIYFLSFFLADNLVLSIPKEAIVY